MYGITKKKGSRKPSDNLIMFAFISPLVCATMELVILSYPLILSMHAFPSSLFSPCFHVFNGIRFEADIRLSTERDTNGKSLLSYYVYRPENLRWLRTPNPFLQKNLPKHGDSDGMLRGACACFRMLHA